MARRVIAGPLFTQSWDELDAEIKSTEDALPPSSLGAMLLPTTSRGGPGVADGEIIISIDGHARADDTESRN